MIAIVAIDTPIIPTAQYQSDVLIENSIRELPKWTDLFPYEYILAQEKICDWVIKVSVDCS